MIMFLIAVCETMSYGSAASTRQLFLFITKITIINNHSEICKKFMPITYSDDFNLIVWCSSTTKTIDKTSFVQLDVRYTFTYITCMPLLKYLYYTKIIKVKS